MSQPSFLQREWPEVFDAAARAEATVHADPRAACFYARRALELAVAWAYKHDAALKLPYFSQESQSLIEEWREEAEEVRAGKADLDDLPRVDADEVELSRRGWHLPAAGTSPPAAAPPRRVSGIERAGGPHPEVARAVAG
jgi:hypothetical protein